MKKITLNEKIKHSKQLIKYLKELGIPDDSITSIITFSIIVFEHYDEK